MGNLWNLFRVFIPDNRLFLSIPLTYLTSVNFVIFPHDVSCQVKVYSTVLLSLNRVFACLETLNFIVEYSFKSLQNSAIVFETMLYSRSTLNLKSKGKIDFKIWKVLEKWLKVKKKYLCGMSFMLNWKL